jgi:putative transposase
MGHRSIFDVSIARHERNAPMTHHDFDLSALAERLEERPDLDLVREMVSMLYQALIDAEATEAIGADRFERSLTRSTRRNGSRPRTLSTKGGDVELKIPKLRKGSFFPSVLERRRRIDQALYAVVMGPDVHGVSTRKVDDLVVALGVDAGISKSEVSRICAAMDADLEAFRDRDLSDTAYPYVFLDATYVKARVSGRVVSRAVVVAMGVSGNGQREILGVAVGDSEDTVFWTECLQGLRKRGLHGVQLVVSDAHLGLKAAISAVLVGAAWQRCRVHFMRNVLAKVPRAQGQMVAALIRTVFAQPDADSVRTQLDEVATSLERRFSVIANMLRDAREDLCAFATFPQAHWAKVWSNNPVERVNAEIKRRTRVVGIFPNDAAVLRLITAVCLEQHDEWLASDRRYLSEASMAQLREEPNTVLTAGTAVLVP